MSPYGWPSALDDLVRSPFARLANLLEGLAPGAPPIDLSLGEPKALIPSFLGPTLQEHLAAFGRYPPIKGIAPLRNAIADWIGRRYPILNGKIDAEQQVLPLFRAPALADVAGDLRGADDLAIGISHR